jgi:hypothetical protein
MLKLYIGCGLTWALPGEEPPEFKRFKTDVELLRRTILATRKWDVLTFVGLSGGRSSDECRQVYVHDIRNCVGRAHVVLGICDWPSIGLGWELGAAVEARGIPTLAVAQRGRNVTRLILGVDHPRFRFREYDNLVHDVPPMLASMARLRGTN